MRLIRDFLRYLVKPSFWFMNYRYNKIWDEWLRVRINPHFIKRTSTHTITVNGVSVWVANYPYAFGNPRVSPPGTHVYRNLKIRPSRQTVERLQQFLKAQEEDPVIVFLDGLYGVKVEDGVSK